MNGARLSTNLIITILVLVSASVYGYGEPAEMSANNGLYIRSPLVRTFYNRLLEDRKHENSKHESWYSVDLAKFDEEVCAKFIQSHQDEGTEEFLTASQEKSDWFFTQLYHKAAKSVLSLFMTNTSINGILGRGSMFVYSKTQFRSLLGVESTWMGENLLDIGAGDGAVTSIMASCFKRTDVTEMAPSMIPILQRKGYSVVGVDDWMGQTYDAISCLNVIDRCDRPMTMLRNIRKSLRPVTGLAIVAFVLPFRPYVEFESEDHSPTELLLVDGETFEEQAVSFIKDIFKNAGLKVVKFTKLPYLCEGDMSHSFYNLTDVVFVLKSL